MKRQASLSPGETLLPSNNHILSVPFGIDLHLLQDEVLSVLASHRDLYHTHTSQGTAPVIRDSLSLHILDHVTKYILLLITDHILMPTCRKRRRVLKNNERLAHALKAGVPTPEDVQDQGFTRPSVLILLPFRSSAVRWLESMIAHTPPPSFQIENMTRFRKEFGLPDGVADKFASAEPDAYPRDHVETFEGNPDDNFRVGLRLTRKSIRLFTEFYGSDIIIASPLGLRMSIEKEKYSVLCRSFACVAHSDAVRNFDFLSSIEILVADQVDSLTMQNWEHTQVRVTPREYQSLVTTVPLVCLFPPQSASKRVARHRLFSYQAMVSGWAVRVPGLVASRKLIPCRVAYLRQTVLLSAYETPDIRSIYTQSLKNLEGSVRTFRRWAPVQVPEGLDQVHSSLAETTIN